MGKMKIRYKGMMKIKGKWVDGKREGRMLEKYVLRSLMPFFSSHVSLITISCLKVYV